MYIDYKTWEDFEKVMYSLNGQFLSPGAVAIKYGVVRGAVHHWIVRNNLITAHRYKGSQGTFVIIPIEELVEIDKFKNKNNFKEIEG